MSCICDLCLCLGRGPAGTGPRRSQIWCLLLTGPELELSPSGLVGLLPLTCLSLLAPQGPYLGLASSLMDPPIGLRVPTEGAEKGRGQEQEAVPTMVSPLLAFHHSPS